jgi:hypothetical protein
MTGYTFELGRIINGVQLVNIRGPWQFDENDFQGRIIEPPIPETPALIDGQIVDSPEARAVLHAEAAAEEQARINGLAWKYGGLVGALAAYLARVGWAIPCEAEAVTADLLQRDLGGLLTPDQKDAKANVADTYMLLTAAGLSNPDIAAIWERVKP